MIRLVALDIDGTLLDSKDRLSKENREAIVKASEQGVAVVICTGRALDTIPEELLDGTIRYAITSNGARILDLRTGEVIASAYHRPESVDFILSEAKKFYPEIVVEVFAEGSAHDAKEQYEVIESYGLGERHDKYVRRTRRPEEDIFKFGFENREQVENICLKFKDMELRNSFFKKMLMRDDFVSTASFVYNVEFGALDATKGNGIMKLCKVLGIDISETMGIGDGLNDMEMLRTVAFPVAMENAFDEIKAVAKYITSSNNESGVAKAINKFVIK